MKKIFIVITLLTTFFLSPIKAEDITTWPYMIISADLNSGGTVTDTLLKIYIDPQYNGSVYYDLYENKIYNKSNTTITGMAQFNGTFILISCESESNEWKAHYGQNIEDPVIATASTARLLSVGNGFEMWSESISSDNVDLSTIQTYLLIISFLLFINFLRG